MQLMNPRERQRPILFDTSRSVGVTSQCQIQCRTALGTPAPDYSSGFTSEAFPMSRYSTRQRRSEIGVFLLPNELLTSPTCPKQLVLRCQWPAFVPLLSVETVLLGLVATRKGQELDLLMRGCLRSMQLGALWELLPSAIPGCNSLKEPDLSSTSIIKTGYL